MTKVARLLNTRPRLGTIFLISWLAVFIVWSRLLLFAVLPGNRFDLSYVTYLCIVPLSLGQAVNITGGPKGPPSGSTFWWGFEAPDSYGYLWGRAFF